MTNKYSAVVKFLVNQIIAGNITYTEVASSRPDLVNELNLYLIDINMEYYIVG